MPICILLLSFVFCVSPFVVLHYGPFTVSPFTGTKFDILWHVTLGKGKGISFFIVLLDQMVSVALYSLTPGRGLTQPWCVPSICPPYVFASPNFTPWYGGASQLFKETCSASSPAAVMVVMAVGIEPGPPTYKPCLLTTTLPWLTQCHARSNIQGPVYILLC